MIGGKIRWEAVNVYLVKIPLLDPADKLGPIKNK